MSFEPYQLTRLLSSGLDGTAYLAHAGDARSSAEIRILDRARADHRRWPNVERRLRLAALVHHPAAVPIHALHLDRDPPFIVLEPTTAWQPSLPLSEADACRIGRDLAGALAVAHRLGLAHGCLDRQPLRCRDPADPLLDFSGINTLGTENLLPESAVEGIGLAARAEDIRALGSLLASWLHGGAPRKISAPLQALLERMQAADPADRPAADDVVRQLTLPAELPGVTGEFVPGPDFAADPPTIHADPSNSSPSGTDDLQGKSQLGRFRILHKLGQGGMGAVYRAEDLADGTPVAIKVLRLGNLNQPRALQRFHKEARLLAEVNNPYVTNLLEINEDAGIHYLALEFVEGQSLGRWLAEHHRMPETQAVQILADVARALVEAHERGIVHRDIKPDNILLLPSTGEESSTVPSVKLTDFGLARHVVETESLQVTQTGALLGTPLYMAPEQCIGGQVDARADIYAMGVTLFHLLAGRPPFTGPTQLSLVALHCHEPPPPLRSLNPIVSEAVCQVVEKCLAKDPSQRYANAETLLRDLERILRGEPTTITVHPRLPPHDPQKIIQYDWSWHLEASPEQLWPHVANTNRLNRAVGIPAVKFSTQVELGRGVRRFGELRKAGLVAAWEEHPFEWVEGRRFAVLREYRQGPFRWLVSAVELSPRAGGGTLLVHRVRILPNGLLGRTAAAVEVGLRGRRAVERVYHRIDAALTGKLGDSGITDPFEPVRELAPRRRQVLDRLLDRLVSRGLQVALVQKLGDYLATAAPQEVARIRPLALAQRLRLDPDALVETCLHGAHEGLLLLLWDILCPVCRIPSEVKDSLKALRDHGRCDVCNLDFELDFANSVELIFRVHPQVRDSELGTYCVGGPAHSPHVVAQVRVAPGERIELDLNLAEGAYRLRGPQLPYIIEFRVLPTAALSNWELDLAHPPGADLPRSLRVGSQRFALINTYSTEVVARIERTAPRVDALTAARASTLGLFRQLFPNETLTPGQLIQVAQVTLLVSQLANARSLYQSLGDAQAFALLHEHFRSLQSAIEAEGGALVKTVGEGVLAVFHEPAAALRAGLRAQATLRPASTTQALCLQMGIAHGTALAATINDRLDYFGSVVHLAQQLPAIARPGEIVLTAATVADPAVAAMLAARTGVEVFFEPLRDLGPMLLHRLPPSSRVEASEEPATATSTTAKRN